MKRGHLGAWLVVAFGGIYFLAPLVATFEFSLRMRRGEYSFDAYRVVFASGNFQASFLYSTIVALVTIVVAALIVVPAAYFVQLRLPRLRGVVEFITLLPLVIPAIVLVFGYIRLYGSSSVLPLTATSLGADALLTFGYVGLGLPYMYRSVDAGLRAIDVRTLTEAAESQGAGAVTILFHVILPNIRSAILSGAFLTFAIVIGEFTFASLLDRPAFGPYLQLIGDSRAYEPAALAVMAFALTWACLGLIQLVGGAPAPGVRRQALGMFLALTGVRETFGAEAVVKDFNLMVERGELVTFLGPSGCGKTTTLRMIAGFETPTEGSIRIDGRDVTHLSARRRAIGMVFQAYALFPHMAVERNIVFGLKVAGMPGTLHRCQGQEAVAVGVCSALRADDLIYSTHRPVGHLIAKGPSLDAITAEIWVKATGCVGGKGSQMHLSDFSVGAMVSNAIVGANIPMAAGSALAFRMLGLDRVAVSLFGDGASNIGAFREGVNLAAVKRAPAIFVCENNLYAASTHISPATNIRDIADRAAAYGMLGVVVDGMDVEAVHAAAAEAVARARRGDGPTLIECKTYRYRGHSRGDPGSYRHAEEHQAGSRASR